MGVFCLEHNERIQLNVRISKETAEKLDQIVEYYQQGLKLGRIYKGDVLTDIIEKSFDLMNKQKKMNRRY
ncbi:hypothetical protein [Bacillus sp. FJAT-29814]|uniref:hypothetical protein n=1 Tax=Bacillus sp. FJAT-29814 TaxID=1729688 RepID=UPI000832ECF1|nr:hypothetical protein [Bacillus sp. FJAT-29814]